MAAYNWIVILLALGFFGLLYGCTYDIVGALHTDAYTGDADAELANGIIWMCWKYAPVACLISVIIYAYMHGQKQGGGF